MARRFGVKFRQKALDLVLKTNCPVKQVAQALGIGRSTLANWLFLYKKGRWADKGFATGDRRLKKEPRALKSESEILHYMTDFEEELESEELDMEP